VHDVDWDRTVFALISPDALARHLGFAVLERIESAGFAPVAWRVLWHRPADLDAFHERNITRSWQAYRYRLVDQLFAFGPTVALLMADERPADERPAAGLRPAGQGSHQRLSLAKGSSDPAKAGPGTIRGDLGSINGMLSLMHSAESAADSAQESAVFAGLDGFTRGSDPAELRTLLTMLALSTPREDRGYRAVLAGLRARVLAGAWHDLPRPVRKTAGAMLEAGAAELGAPGSGERLAGLLPGAHPLAGLLRADFTPRTPGPDPQRVRQLLAAFGTGIDEWESLVLATSRRFWPCGADPDDQLLR
jgi:nucleoside diphosphate kinase